MQAEPEEGLQQFLDDSVPVLDDQEMEDLYRHFLEDELPEVRYLKHREIFVTSNCYPFVVMVRTHLGCNPYN